MGIKRVLLPFCDTENLRPVAEAAFVVARRFSAAVRGLYIQRSSMNIAFNGEYADPEIVRQILENARKDKAERRERAGGLFQKLANKFHNVESEFTTQEGDLDEITAHATRLADVSVLGIDTAHLEGERYKVRNGALFRSGRPVLFVPQEGVGEYQFDRVVIAWKESTEAARAVAAAQAFMLNAKEVYLITVGESYEVAMSLQDVEQYLQLHHAELRSEAIPQSAGSVGEVLLRKVEALGGAVLVMGAYSHWRWQEQMFGGATEYMLREARVPVLMAH